jgi:hypothetical protein
MTPSSWNGIPTVAIAMALAACGGTTAQPATVDAGGPDAHADVVQPGDDAAGGDAPADSPLDAPGYLACMDPSGQVDGSLKACKSDAECVMKQEQIDCCGTILYVGIASSSASAFDACEAAWEAHFPGCGCDSGQTNTEDGKVTYPFGDAAAPKVHCTDFTLNGGVCMTYTP